MYTICTECQMLPLQSSKTEFAVCIPQCSYMLEQVCPYRHTLMISEYVEGISYCPCSGAIPLLFHFQVTHCSCLTLPCGSSVPVPFRSTFRKMKSIFKKMLHFGKIPKNVGLNLAKIRQNSGKICKICKNLQKKSAKISAIFNEKIY